MIPDSFQTRPSSILRTIGRSVPWLIITALTANAGGEGGGGDLIGVGKEMMFWTWVTFALLLLVLYKFAWKPILRALDEREHDIRESVETAERIRKEMAEIEESREKKIKEADDKAKEIVATARKAAVEASKVIEDKAKDEAKILLENARADIKAATEKAESQLREEAANLAISLAASLLRENLDNEKNRALTDRLIKEL